MGDTVSKLIERNIAVHVLDGMAFKCHRVNAGLCIEAFGVGCLAVVGDGTERRVELDAKHVNKQLGGDGQAAMQKLLKVAMISPKLGDADDEKNDTVTWRTLGDYGPRLFQAVMGQTNEAAQGFPESSEVPTG